MIFLTLKDKRVVHMRIIHTMQAVAENYILTLYPTFTCSLGENNGLFQEESNETEEVSINQFIAVATTY